MSDYQKKSEQAAEDNVDLIAKLEELGRAMDSAEYPGRAWAEPPGLQKKWIIRILAASGAAAAILLIAFTMRGPLDPPKEAPEPRVVSATTAQPAMPLAVVVEPLFSIDIPANIELDLASGVNFTPPATSLPAITNISPAVIVDFDLPTLSTMWIE